MMSLLVTFRIFMRTPLIVNSWPTANRGHSAGVSPVSGSNLLVSGFMSKLLSELLVPKFVQPLIHRGLVELHALTVLMPKPDLHILT